MRVCRTEYGGLIFFLSVSVCVCVCESLHIHLYVYVCVNVGFWHVLRKYSGAGMSAVCGVSAMVESRWKIGLCPDLINVHS